MLPAAAARAPATTAIIAIYQLPGSNALQNLKRHPRKLMAQMKDRFPEDVEYAISLDQTLPVSEGMKEVVETLVIDSMTMSAPPLE